MISLRNVKKDYFLKGRTIPAVNDVSLDIDTGEFIIITGRSGCGKTTLLNLVAGMIKPTQGIIEVSGTEIWRMSDREQANFRNRKIGFVFQFPSLIPSLTVLENVLLPTIFGDRQEKTDAKQRALDLLALVGLEDKLDAHPSQLSGGQQQRVVIARALINQPEVLLADEPSSNLDEHTEEEIMELIQDVHQRTGLTIMLVTHSNELGRYGTRDIRMAEGKIISGLNLAVPA